jgi:hypothetical protein
VQADGWTWDDLAADKYEDDIYPETIELESEDR